MSDLIDRLATELAGSRRRVAFVECQDERILSAARRLADERVAQPVFVCEPEAVREAAASIGMDLDGIELIDVSDESLKADLADSYHAVVPAVSSRRAARKASLPINYAAMLVKTGEADCLAAGVVHSTGEVIVAARQFIGLSEGIETVSSVGFVEMRLPWTDEPRWVAISDCAVNTDPDDRALADIAICTSRTARSIFGEEPRVAMLSYSTKGSSDGPSVDRVRRAVANVVEREPDLKIDGEFQLEVALSPELAARKLKGAQSSVAGLANVLVFPCLDAGNIAVKCMQLFGRFSSPGPILQGFSRPVTDFSRSASKEDVYANIVLALSLKDA